MSMRVDGLAQRHAGLARSGRASHAGDLAARALDHPLVPGVDALVGVGQPVAVAAEDLDRPDALLGPVGEMGDVVAQRPAGRDLADVPAIERDASRRRASKSAATARVLRRERGVVDGPRVVDERVAVDLAGAKRRSAHGSMTARWSR